MLTRIEALNYRSLRYVTQRVSRFQTLVGPNGSGKSTFLDVVGFLGDMLRVGPLDAIRGGRTIPPRAADPAHLCWMRSGDWFELAVEMEIPQHRLARLGNGKSRQARYEVRVEFTPPAREVILAAETFWLRPTSEYEDLSQRDLFPALREVPTSIVHPPRGHALTGWKKIVSKGYPSGNDYFMSETSGWNNPFRLGPSKSALANLPDDEERFPVASWAKRALMDGVHRVVLNAEAMRLPSPPGSPLQFLPDGSNLPWVIHEMEITDRTQLTRWVDHVRTAIPDIKTITTIERPEDRHRYITVEYDNGLKAPSWVVSDGTLRLLALTLLSYVNDLQGIYLIEEPENGIHPRAVETIYQSLSSVYGAQILCASHSPVVLGMAQPSDLLCFAKDRQEGATDIVRGDEHPRLREWKGELDLGTLFAAGVLG